MVIHVKIYQKKIIRIKIVRTPFVNVHSDIRMNEFKEWLVGQERGCESSSGWLKL